MFQEDHGAADKRENLPMTNLGRLLDEKPFLGAFVSVLPLSEDGNIFHGPTNFTRLHFERNSGLFSGTSFRWIRIHSATKAQRTPTGRTTTATRVGSHLRNIRIIRSRNLVNPFVKTTDGLTLKNSLLVLETIVTVASQDRNAFNRHLERDTRTHLVPWARVLKETTPGHFR